MYQLYRPLEIQSTLSIPVRLEFHKFINFIWRSIKVTYPTTRIILFISSCGSPEPHDPRVKLVLLHTPSPPPPSFPLQWEAWFSGNLESRENRESSFAFNFGYQELTGLVGKKTRTTNSPNNKGVVTYRCPMKLEVLKGCYMYKTAISRCSESGGK